MNRKNVIAICIATAVGTLVCVGNTVDCLKKEYQGQIEQMVQQHQSEITALNTAWDTDRTSWGERAEALQSQLTAAMTRAKDAEKVSRDLLANGNWAMVEGIATAYSPLDNRSGICAEGDPNVTSTGIPPGHGVIAVDPSRIPYDSEILVIYPDGTKYYGISGDTGGALRDDPVTHIDIYKSSYEEAMSHGEQNVIILWRPYNGK